MPIILTGGTDQKILLTSHGKITLSLGCCCGSPSPSPGPSPWPSGEPSVCDCYDTLPAVGSLTITGWPADNGGSYCDQPCTGPFYNYYLCSPDDRTYLTYLYQVRVWYLPCEACPSSNPEELWDPTRVRGQIGVELKYQQLTYGATPPYVGGGTLNYGYCYTTCTHVARCQGGTCNIDFGFDNPVTVAMTI